MSPEEAGSVCTAQDRLVIATPCYGGNLKLGYVNALFRACTELSVRVRTEDGRVGPAPLVAGRLHIDKESHIDRARNKLANRFLRDTDCNWLLFIDADVVFDPAHVAELWRHGQRGHSLVAAPYALKQVVPKFVITALAGAKRDEHGLIEVGHAGTGFLLVHRKVFTDLAAQGLAPEYQIGVNDPEHAHHGSHRAFFKSGVREIEGEDGKRAAHWMSEDFLFCHEARQCGHRVLMDARMQLGHIGDLTYPPPPGALVEALRALRQSGHPALPDTPI